MFIAPGGARNESLQEASADVIMTHSHATPIMDRGRFQGQRKGESQKRKLSDEGEKCILRHYTVLRFFSREFSRNNTFSAVLSVVLLQVLQCQVGPSGPIAVKDCPANPRVFIFLMP